MESGPGRAARRYPFYTIRFLTIHTAAHSRVHTSHSIPSQGSILSSALLCELAWSCAIPRRGGSANPSRITKRAHESHTRPVSVRVAGLYSTRGILKLDTRSQGQRRRTEEKAHSHQSRVVYPVTRRVYIYYYDICGVSQAGMGECGFCQPHMFREPRLKKVAPSSLVLSQASCSQPGSLIQPCISKIDREIRID
jgi:hypothetical protein